MHFNILVLVIYFFSSFFFLEAESQLLKRVPLFYFNANLSRLSQGITWSLHRLKLDTLIRASLSPCCCSAPQRTAQRRGWRLELGVFMRSACDFLGLYACFNSLFKWPENQVSTCRSRNALVVVLMCLVGVLWCAWVVSVRMRVVKPERRDRHAGSIALGAFALFIFKNNAEILKKPLKTVASGILYWECFWLGCLVFSVLIEESSNLKSAMCAWRCSAPLAIGCKPHRVRSDSPKCAPGVLSGAWLGCCSACNHSLETPPFA